MSFSCGTFRLDGLRCWSTCSPRRTSPSFRRLLRSAVHGTHWTLQILRSQASEDCLALWSAETWQSRGDSGRSRGIQSAVNWGRTSPKSFHISRVCAKLHQPQHHQFCPCDIRGSGYSSTAFQSVSTTSYYYLRGVDTIWYWYQLIVAQTNPTAEVSIGRRYCIQKTDGPSVMF